MKKHEKYQYKPTPFMLPTSHYDKTAPTVPYCSSSP